MSQPSQSSNLSASPDSRHASTPTVDDADALDRVRRYLTVPGISGREQAIADAVIADLRKAGVPSDAISFDTANTRTTLAGEVGNLIVRLPSTLDRPARLFSAHLDTVPLAEGCQPIEDETTIRAGGNGRGLGADNRTGTAVLATLAKTLLASGVPHGPIVLVWFVQEEIGLHGSRHMDVAALGPVACGFNFDGGDVAKVTTGATGAYRIQTEWTGRAAHAGGAPEKGASALTAASVAVARLHDGGWLGKIEKDAGTGTANVGVFRAGEATNVVTDRASVRAEIRSHDSAFRDAMLANFRTVCHAAAASVRTLEGTAVTVEIAATLDYHSFRLPADSPAVRLAEAGVHALGRTPIATISNGGLDANWLARHGIETVTLGCGQVAPHTVEEQLEKRDYLDACRLAVWLATAES